ncbi:MAG: GNAT family N-acetyltransferase, partial [Pseudomonadales bacterium]|nr:GNAT family N-acetyltransferase [Pseudomonadales bacterium]
MSLQQEYLRCQSQAAVKSHRQLLWLSGEQSWCYRQLAQLAVLLQNQQSIAVFDPIAAAKSTDVAILNSLCRAHISVKECHKYLGFEHQSIVFDGYSGFNPDSLAQISGTLIASGVLILVTPEVANWQAWADPELDKLWVQPYQMEDVSRHFLTWLKLNLLQDSQLCRYSQNDDRDRVVDRSAVAQSDTEALLPITPSSAGFQINPSALEHQWQLVADIRAHLSANGLAQAVLMADRGRGKSALLGMLAKQLGAEKSIFLTAADALAVQQVQKFSGYGLAYYTPDKLLSRHFSVPQNSLLLIDEAAAISVEVLLKLLKKFRQCVFSSTMQGYEGTGQGFKLRFLAQLLNFSTHCKTFTLSQPMRWAADDPLEGWLNKVLLLKVQSDEAVFHSNPGNSAARELQKNSLQDKQSDLTISQVTPAQLIASPVKLQQLFSLLSQAHYRTTPGDLRIILDSPNMHLWLACIEQQIVAVCLVASEGVIEQFGIDQQQMNGEQLALAMYQGRRRPRGNLIPQM